MLNVTAAPPARSKDDPHARRSTAARCSDWFWRPVRPQRTSAKQILAKPDAMDPVGAASPSQWAHFLSAAGHGRERPPTAHWQASHWGSQLAAERCCWLAAWPEVLRLQNMCWKFQALASSGGSSRCSTHGAPRGVAQATPRTYRVRVSSATASPPSPPQDRRRCPRSRRSPPLSPLQPAASPFVAARPRQQFVAAVPRRRLHRRRHRRRHCPRQCRHRRRRRHRRPPLFT